MKMMKKLVSIILIGLTGLIAGTAFAVDVDRTIDAASDGHVEVSNISGAITIEGWNQSKVEVTGSIGRDVKELIIERDGDDVLIKVKLPRGSSSASDADLHIKVPEDSSINVGTVSADIDVTAVKGEQSLHTVSGNVTTESRGEDVSAESVSGDVDVSGDNSDSEVEANTVSGDVTLTRVSGEVVGESVSGSVEVEGGSFDRADLNTINGEITFNGELLKGGRLSIETVNGSVDVDFEGDVSAKINIETFNGGIRNCFGPKAERTSKYAPGWELDFTAGDGDGRVDISTMNGRVTICNK
jgi:DUF4097 and DUF4098 domain-containing protein YvlB